MHRDRIILLNILKFINVYHYRECLRNIHFKGLFKMEYIFCILKILDDNKLCLFLL